MSHGTVKQAFLRASSLTGGARQVFLDSLRTRDPATYDEVQELLHHDARDVGTLAPSPALVAEALGGGFPNLDDYALEREIGSGGWGRVFLARHRVTQVSRAIKVLRTRNPRLAERLWREGRLQQTLHHPHVVRVVDVTQTSTEEPALVLEYVAGPTLADLLMAGMALSVAEIFALGRGILEGVAAAHERGWVHRDLKPSNVLLDIAEHRLVPKVSDFGLATVVDGDQAWATGETTQRGGLGTKRYMSLEQLTGQPPHRRMDVYALGALLYELCEGTPAFPTDRHWEQALALGRTPAVRREDLPVAFKETVDLALSAMGTRPEHASELLARWTLASSSVASAFQPQTLRLAVLLQHHVLADGLVASHPTEQQREHLSVCARCRDARRGPLSAGALALEMSPTAQPEVAALSITVRSGAHVGEPAMLHTAEDALQHALEQLRASWQELEPGHLTPALGAVLHLADGSDAPIVVRQLAQVGAPGQLLASRVFVDALPGRAGLHVTSHGHWQSLDRVGTVEILELRDPAWGPGVPLQATPTSWRVVLGAGRWRPIREIPSSLPPESTRFVGRREVLEELCGCLRSHRLVTLHGSPGIGKTRTALRFAATWLGAWPGGVWFCEAAVAHDEPDLCRVVAAAMNVPLAAHDPVDTVGAALRSRGRCLLILDNLEQLGPLASDVVGRWLAGTEEASILTTSRTPLGLPSERVVRLGPLHTSDAVALFQHRATHAGASIDPTADHDAMAALVGELDHVPLAIELCAARTRLLSPADMLTRLEERFRLVASHTAAGRPDRHVSLHACLAWSWEQLEPRERATLAQLAVFAPGFTVAAAEAVLDLPGPTSDPLLVVEALLDHALLRLSGTGRLSLLISVKEFAADHLDPSARERAEERHGTYYARYGDLDWLEGILGREQATIREALAEELDNLVLASERARARGAHDVAAATATAAWFHLRDHGPLEMAASLLEGAALGAGEPSTWAMVYAAGARQLLGHADVGRRHLTEALERAETLGAPLLLGVIHEYLGSAHLQAADPNGAQIHVDTALALYTQAGSRARQAMIEAMQGRVTWRAGDPKAARTWFERSRDGHREVHNEFGEAEQLFHLAILDRQDGHFDDAQRRNLKALQIFRTVGSPLQEARVLGNLGNIYRGKQEYDQALAFSEASLEIVRTIGYRLDEAGRLNNLGVLHRLAGDFVQAESCFVEALKIYEDTDDPRTHGEVLCNYADLQNLRGHVPEARALYLQAIAALRSAGHRAFEGMALGNLAMLCLEHDDLDEAEQYMADALQVHRQTGRTRSEAFVIYLLGDLSWRREAVRHAEGQYEQAAEMARSTGYRELEAVVMGRLALVHATAGRHDRAEACLGKADAALGSGASVSTELGLLCDRARVYARGEQPERAEKALHEANRRFSSLELGPDSLVARRLAAANAEVGRG